MEAFGSRYDSTYYSIHKKLHEVPEIVFSLIKISWMIQFFDFCLVLAMICQFLSKKIFCLASLKVELAYLRF